MPTKLNANCAYYNKELDTCIYVSNWALDGKKDLYVEVFHRKEPCSFNPFYFGNLGIVAYEADDSFVLASEFDPRGYKYLGKQGNTWYMTSRYGGGSNTEVDIVIPREREFIRQLNKKLTIQKFKKLALKYDDVLNNPKYSEKNK